MLKQGLKKSILLLFFTKHVILLGKEMVHKRGNMYVHYFGTNKKYPGKTLSL